MLGIKRPPQSVPPPLVFDRRRLDRLRVWSIVAVVPPLVVLAAFLAYLLVSLALGGGKVAGEGTAPYEAVIGFPVFAVPAWTVVIAGSVALVATVVMVIGSGFNQGGWLLSAFRVDAGAALASAAFGALFGPSAQPDEGGIGRHWVGAVGFAASGLLVVVRLLMLAPTESALRRADAVFVLPGLSLPPAGPQHDLFTLECPPGWRTELVDGPDPVRFVADVADELVAFDLLVGPLAPDVDSVGASFVVGGAPVVRTPPQGARETPEGTRTVRYHVSHPSRAGGVTITATIAAPVAARRDRRHAVVETADRIVETFRWRSPRRTS